MLYEIWIMPGEYPAAAAIQVAAAHCGTHWLCAFDSYLAFVAHIYRPGTAWVLLFAAPSQDSTFLVHSLCIPPAALLVIYLSAYSIPRTITCVDI